MVSPSSTNQTGIELVFVDFFPITLILTAVAGEAVSESVFRPSHDVSSSLNRDFRSVPPVAASWWRPHNRNNNIFGALPKTTGSARRSAWKPQSPPIITGACVQPPMTGGDTNVACD